MEHALGLLYHCRCHLCYLSDIKKLLDGYNDEPFFLPLQFSVMEQGKLDIKEVNLLI